MSGLWIREERNHISYSMQKGQYSSKLSWDVFHMALHLPQPGPVWMQTVNRLLFNQMLVAAIQQDEKQKYRPQETSSSFQQQMGAGKENIIRYMAGYIPF